MKLPAVPLPRRVNTIIHSVRFRLALWFAMVLTLVLLFFISFVYYRTVQDVRGESAARIIGRLRDLQSDFLRTYENYDQWAWWLNPEISPNETFTLQENEILVVSDVYGNPAAFWGNINDQESEQIASLVTRLKPDNYSAHFYPYELADGEDSPRKVNYMISPTPAFYENQLLGWIIIGQPVDPNGILPRLGLTLAIATLFTLMVALVGGYWLADRVLWPVKVVTRTAQEISETDLSRRLNLNTQDELGELASTFDRMLDRLQAGFNRQRQFTADASHELRTPLTIISLEANHALEGKRTVEEYRQALNVIQGENAFMSHLVGELLTLARMDAGQVNLKHEPLDLSDIALDVIERFSQLAGQKEISLQAGELPEVLITGDRQYLSQMIGNLVDNAINYNPPGPGQWVQVETGTCPGTSQPMAWLRVSDNGPGISEEHLPHLFDRFYRVDQARSHNPEKEDAEVDIAGSGLGLSIVQWIAREHGGFATVESRPGQGGVFEVHLPLAR